MHELVEDHRGGLGVGSHLRLWRTTVPIRADIGAGQTCTLNPAFIQPYAYLLGRADFFSAFTVTFEEAGSGPVFHLDVA